MPDFQCPQCYSTKHKEKYLKDKAYVCDGILEMDENQKCNNLIKAYCKQCDKYYDDDNFGKQGDVYVCKECGTIQWGVTEYYRDYEDTFFINFFKKFANTMSCSFCGYTAKADKDILEDGLLVCEKCGRLMYSDNIACFKCKQTYSFKRYGYHNGAYICKKCNSIQWGLTEYARRKTK